ncbi:rhomboid family-domain-containing protein [Syncephalis plumigaleata]|nr:rhomboid family-domain-containing protein [Syncephalis plumigaleata]
MASIIAIQIVILLVEMAVNYQLTGSFIQTGNAFNYLIGPGSLAWIRSGARFTASMSLSDICGFGGFPSGTPDQWYRLIIPIFLHGGLLHLLFNGVFQWRTGMQMEREWGAIRLAPIYLLGGIGGFLLGAVVAPVQMISLGASGSVFALLAASMIDLLQHWNETAGRGRQMAELVVIIVLSFVIGLLPGIDNFAHIGGFLFGIFTSLVFLPPTAGRFWKVSRWIGGAIVITLYVVLFVVFYTEADPQSTCPWCKYLSCLPINGWCDAFDNNNNNPSRSSM